MTTIYLARREGMHDFGADHQVPEGAVIEIVAPTGYRYRHVFGGVWLYRTWWRKLLDWVF